MRRTSYSRAFPFQIFSFYSSSRWMLHHSQPGQAGQRLLLDADTLHLRIGQYILSTGANVSRSQDLFAFSKPPTAWYAFEWLIGDATFTPCVSGLVGFKGMALLAGSADRPLRYRFF